MIYFIREILSKPIYFFTQIWHLYIIVLSSLIKLHWKDDSCLLKLFFQTNVFRPRRHSFPLAAGRHLLHLTSCLKDFCSKIYLETTRTNLADRKTLLDFNARFVRCKFILSKTSPDFDKFLSNNLFVRLFASFKGIIYSRFLRGNVKMFV